MTPLISVLMPSYNHERYVESAVRSVLEQDWPRVELLVSDDGSTDSTWEALQRLRPECERRLERVMMERHDNMGTCRTLERLRKAACGDYILMVASDDAFLPGAFKSLLNPMLEDENIGVTVGRNELMDGDGRTCYWDENRAIVHDRAKARYVYFNDFIREARGVDDMGPDFGTYSALLKANHVVNGYMIRKTVLDRIPEFTPEAPLEDLWLHLQLSKITRYAAIPEATFRYRWHAANTIKDTARMRDVYKRTLLWEERIVEQLPDPRWRAAFSRRYWDVRRKFGFGEILKLEKVLTLCEHRYVLTVMGRSFVLSRKLTS